MAYTTDQEAFWAGTFGDEYVQRNRSRQLLASNLAFWSRILAPFGPVRSVLEIGANIGMNLMALDLLFPEVELEGIEINATAAGELASWGRARVQNESILDYKPQRDFDLVLTKGVLIHLNPDILPQVYDIMEKSSSRLLCIAEYYNPVPVQIDYRGHQGKLFKRDFAGEMLERHANFKLLDYGFAYRKDPSFPQDDITWFLMEKKKTGSHDEFAPGEKEGGKSEVL